jgi:hypothetical protein
MLKGAPSQAAGSGPRAEPALDRAEVGVLYMLVQVFLTGGLWACCAPAGGWTVRGLLHGSGSTSALLRLALVSPSGLVDLFLLHGPFASGPTCGRANRVGARRTIGRHVLLLLAILFVNMVNGYAKAAIVLEERSSALLAWISSLSFCLRHLGRVVAHYALLAVAAVVLLGVWNLLDGAWNTTGYKTQLLTLLLLQGFVFAASSCAWPCWAASSDLPGRRVVLRHRGGQPRHEPRAVARPSLGGDLAAVGCTRWRAMAQASPGPPWLRPSPSAWRSARTWGRNSGLMPWPVSSTSCGPSTACVRAHAAALLSELHRVGDQVPPLCWPVHVAAHGGQAGRPPPPAPRPWRPPSGAPCRRPPPPRAHLAAPAAPRVQLALTMRVTSSRSEMSWLCARALRSCWQRALHVVRRQPALAQDLGPAHDGERRAARARQWQELVLHAVGVLRRRASCSAIRTSSSPRLRS